MFQYGTSTEQKQRTEANSTAQRGGKCLTDSSAEIKQFIALTKKRGKFKLRFQSKSNYAFLKIGLQTCFLGYHLLILLWQEQKILKMLAALSKECDTQPLSSSRE